MSALSFLQNDNILLFTVSAVWFVNKQKPIHVSSIRKQNCCDGPYAQCVDLRKKTACSCSYTALEEFESMYLYICIYIFLVHLNLSACHFKKFWLQKSQCQQVIIHQRGNRCCHMLLEGRKKTDWALQKLLFLFFLFSLQVKQVFFINRKTTFNIWKVKFY